MDWALTDRPDGDARRTTILRVARQCFERYGVHRTRIEDVAEAVGISRPMVYKFFATRDQLIDAVLVDQMRELAETLGPRVWASDTLAEAVVEGSVLLVEAARADPNLEALVLTPKSSPLTELLLRPQELARAMTAHIWRPVLERARGRGEVRDDLDEDRFNEWLSCLHLIFWLRRDLDYDHMRILLNTFLVPALHPFAASLDTRRPRPTSSPPRRPAEAARPL